MSLKPPLVPELVLAFTLGIIVALVEGLGEIGGVEDNDGTVGRVDLAEEVEADMVEAGMEVTTGSDVSDEARAGSRDGNNDTSVLSVADSGVAAKAGMVALAAEATTGGVHRPLLNVVAAASAAIPSELSMLSSPA